MDLIKPDIGLLFWMVVSFLAVFWLLKKFAFKPILASIKEREDSINNALLSAEKAKQEMADLQATNEKLLQEARAERDVMLKQARDAKDNILAEAKAKADEESARMIASAREAINNEKMAAVTELKNNVAQLSIDIAEKILKRELSSADSHKELINKYLEEAKLN